MEKLLALLLRSSVGFPSPLQATAASTPTLPRAVHSNRYFLLTILVYGPHLHVSFALNYSVFKDPPAPWLSRTRSPFNDIGAVFTAVSA